MPRDSKYAGGDGQAVIDFIDLVEGNPIQMDELHPTRTGLAILRRRIDAAETLIELAEVQYEGMGRTYRLLKLAMEGQEQDWKPKLVK